MSPPALSMLRSKVHPSANVYNNMASLKWFGLSMLKQQNDKTWLL
jgi:hypothetical protein